jgi:hypothetical protein
MNLLIKILTKLGLLKKDLDYHLVRASMVIIYFFFGYQKWACLRGGHGSFCGIILFVEAGCNQSVTFGGFGQGILRHL